MKGGHPVELGENCSWPTWKGDKKKKCSISNHHTSLIGSCKDNRETIKSTAWSWAHMEEQISYDKNRRATDIPH